MAATITRVGEAETTTAERPVFLVTRRELVVLTVAIGAVLGAILLLVVTSGQMAAALASSG